MRQRLRSLLFAGLLASALAPAAHAVDGYVGAAFGHSTRADHNLVAAELIWPIDSPLRLNLNVEYFRAADVRHYTTSLDVAYFGSLRPIDPRLTGWVGLGLGLLTQDPVGPRQDTTRDGQLDFIAGVGFEGPVMPFVQLKLAARKPTYLIGVRFAL
jgi:hypothetical protein